MTAYPAGRLDAAAAQAFAPGHSPRALYAGSSMDTAGQALLLSILGRRRISAVLGPTGAGKTSLMERTVRRLGDDGILVLPVMGVAGASLEALLMTAAADIVDGARSFDEAIERIELCLDRSGMGVFAIDDAHLLDDPVLSDLVELSDSKTESGRALQLLLSGDERLADRLTTVLGRPLEQVATIHRLTPLPPDEAVALLRHRLRVAGIAPEQVAEPHALSRIAALAQGSPGRMIAIARTAFASIPSTPGRRLRSADVDATMEPHKRSGSAAEERPKLRLAKSYGKGRVPDIADGDGGAGVPSRSQGIGAQRAVDAPPNASGHHGGRVRPPVRRRRFALIGAAVVACIVLGLTVAAMAIDPRLMLPPLERISAVLFGVDAEPTLAQPVQPSARSGPVPAPPDRPPLGSQAPDDRPPTTEPIRHGASVPSLTITTRPATVTRPAGPGEPSAPISGPAAATAGPPGTPPPPPPSGPQGPGATPGAGPATRPAAATATAGEAGGPAIAAPTAAAEAAPVEPLLRRAEQQIDAKRLTTPAGNNALETIAAIRALDPSNAEADRLIGVIVDTYLNWARAAERRGGFDDARRFYERALQSRPGDPAVRELLDGLDERASAAPPVAPAFAAATAGDPAASSAPGPTSDRVLSLLSDPDRLGAEITAGVRFDSALPDGRTPLMVAAGNGLSTAVRQLVEQARVPVDQRDGAGWTALMYASAAGHDRAARMLLAYGADPFARNAFGHSAIDLGLILTPSGSTGQVGSAR